MYAIRSYYGTAHRPLPAGRVSPRQALGFFGVLVALAFVLVLTLNRFTSYNFV